MYRLVIVEDEARMRRSLETLIPWNRMGYEVIGAFEDGVEALTFISEHRCDAVLTDILMGKMDGLDLAAQLRTVSPATKVVILSGYNDFGYAKRAIRHKVVDYLLKPVDEEELIAVFRKLKETLDAESDEKQRYAQSVEMVESSFLRNLLSGRIGSREELEVYLRMLGIRADVRSAPLLVYEVALQEQEVPETADPGDAETDAEDSAEEVERLLRTGLSGKDEGYLHYILNEQGGHWRVVAVDCSGGEFSQLKRRTEDLLILFTRQVRNAYGLEVTSELTHALPNMDALLGGLGSSDKREAVAIQAVDSNMYEKLLLQYKVFVVELDMEHYDQISKMLDELAAELSEISFEQARFIVKNLFSMIEMEYRRRSINVKEISSGQFAVEGPQQAKNLEEMIASAKNAFRVLGQGLNAGRSEYNTDVLGRIITYIEAHIDESLSIGKVAAQFRVHPNYLSRIFKQRTGETMLEYVTRVRIEKAICLLKEEKYDIVQISQMVGFSTASYFSTTFRKVTGYSPRDYCYKVLQ